MSLQRLAVTTALIALSALSAAKATQVQTFFSGLGLPPDTTFTAASGISADGSVILGISDGPDGQRATLWFAGGFQSLGTLNGSPNFSTALGISADGKVVVGNSNSLISGPNSEAYRWTAATGMVGLGDFPDGIFNSAAMAASADGSVVVGFGTHGDQNEEAMRWTEATGMVGIGFMSGTITGTGSNMDGRVFSFARDVSGDGSVIVGDGSSSTGNQAFRWTAATGMVGLGALPGAAANRTFSSTAMAVSADGNVVVGYAANAAGNLEAFRWTQAGGMVGLGFLPNPPIAFSAALDASADGKVIVGMANDTDGNNSAVRWVDASGPVRIADLLAAGGVNLGDRRLIAATAVSADGTIIAGSSEVGVEAPFGEGWWAVLPLPSNGCLQSQQNAGKTTKACAPGKPAGFMTANVLATSLQSIGDATQQALRSPSTDLSMALNKSLNANCDKTPDKLCILAQGGEANFGAAPSAEVAAVYRLSDSVSIGTSLSYRAQNNTVSVYDGRTAEEKLSMTAFGAWRSETGLALFGVAVVDGFDQSIERGYLNGIDRVSSTGARNGRALAAAVGAAWPIALSDLTLSPYVRYESTRLMLDRYVEVGGVFPAAFDATDATLQVVRTGVESNIAMGGLNLGVDAVWLHRLGGGAPDIAGRLLAFGSAFNLPGANLRDDWAELSLGLRYQTDEIGLHLSADASNEQGDPAVAANLSVDLRF